jgi:hypothetical protein
MWWSDMPTIADYPDGIGTAGPHISRLITSPVEFEIDVIRYEDGGADVNVQPCGLQRFTLEYEMLTEAELATLRAHYNLAKGQVNDFEFYHRQDNATYAGVKYQSFNIGDHVKAWSQPATVILVRYA